MQRSVDEIIKRHTRAKGVKELWHDLYEDAYKICMPQRNLYEERTTGDDRMDGVFDSTGMIATNSFVNRIQAALTPPARKWMNLKAGPSVPDDQKDELNEALGSVSDIFWNVIRTSNFNRAISEVYYDLAVGTSCMLVLEGDDRFPVQFIAVPNYEI